MRIVYVPNFPENPSNAARVVLGSGEIEINQSVWDYLTEEQRAFVLAHEEGHYNLQTYDETQADRYALKQLACKKPNSLWNFVTSVRAITKENPKRVFEAERAALEVAAEKGSAEAEELLRTHYSAYADGTPALAFEWHRKEANKKDWQMIAVNIGLIGVFIALCFIVKKK